MGTGKFEKAPAQEFNALQMQSARIGADPWQIQGAGGNTSIKHDGVLWIKASGKWLMHATAEQMFVPVDRTALLNAFSKEDPRAEKSVEFIVDELNPSGLRPSIETTLHALLEHSVVIHVHCVDTISIAIRQDAEQYLGKRLAAFNWVYVPYIRPGLPLTRSIATRLQPNTDVLVLGNHGLVVAAQTVDACLALLHKVRLALLSEQRRLPKPQHRLDSRGKSAVLGTELASRLRPDDDYHPAQIAEAHAIAFDEIGLKVAAGGSLYPDHVIFLGEGTAIAQPTEDSDAVVSRYVADGLTEPVSIVFPDAGVVMRKNATTGQQAMARCLSDVCTRVPPSASINYLSAEDNYELLDWESEKYRKALSHSAAD